MTASRRLVRLMVVLTITCNSSLGVLTVDFEDLSLPDNESSWSGSYPVDGIGGTGDLTTFSSRGVAFNNFSDGDWGMWEDFAYSNMSDTTTPGYTNQFSACTGTGYDEGDDIYAVGFVGYSTVPTVVLPGPTALAGGYFTNTTYAALAMLNGDMFAEKFGGDTGDDPDWFLLTITGKDADGMETGTVGFYLADYRFANNELDYIVVDWTWVDLTGLGTNVKSIEFGLSSSDVDNYGYMNTPAYFALDNLVVPEPGTIAVLALGWVLLRRPKNK